MSYLDAPRFHFSGTFFTNPSTINNATENYALDEQYNNLPPSATNPNSVWWNQMGQAFFKFPSIAVTAACDDDGTYVTSDPIVGAQIVGIIAGGPPAQWGRLADLDPDQQGRSLIVGMNVQLTLAGQSSPALTGTIRPMTIIDLWGRVVGGSGGGIESAGAMFMSVIENLAWGDVSASNVLTDLKNASPETLSFKMNVDAYNGDITDDAFATGRVVGTIGPYFAGEPAHVLAKRKMWMGSSSVQQSGPPLMNNALFQVNGSTLQLDLGNSVPTTQVHGGPFMDIGPVVALIGNPASPVAQVPVYATVAEYTSQYNTYAGIFEIELDTAAQQAIAANAVALQITPPASSPAALFGKQAAMLKSGLDVSQVGSPGTAAAASQIPIAENPNGMYAAIDINALRLQNGAPSWADTPDADDMTEITSDAQIPIYMTQYGLPASGTIAVSNFPNVYQFPDSQGNTWYINNVPLNYVQLAGSTAPPGGNSVPTAPIPVGSVTIANGVGTFSISGLALTTQQKAAAEPRRAEVDGQMYFFDYDNSMDQPGLSVLLFESGPYVASPTWWQDVYPIFLQYARLYPFMRGLIDLSNYDAVTKAAAKMQAMLTLPMADPAFMPVTRDLSLLRRDMILRWYQAGAPVGTPPQP